MLINKIRNNEINETVTEVKVDRKPVIIALKIWNILLSITGGILALIGAYSLIDSDLRMEIMTMFNQFIDEIGFFF